MSVNVKRPTQIERYVDENGRLTLEGVKLIQRIVVAVEALDARVTVLEP